MSTHGAFKALDLGPTGTGVAERVHALRSSQNLSYQALSDRLADIGWVIPVLGLRRIEASARRVSVDDLMALAAAFDVSPLELLLPADDDYSGVPAAATAVSELVPAELWGWARREMLLSRGDRLDYWTAETNRVIDQLDEWERIHESAKNSPTRFAAQQKIGELRARLTFALGRLEFLKTEHG